MAYDTTSMEIFRKFECRDCKRYFTINIGFEKMKHNPQGITTAMQLYFSGESFEKCCSFSEVNRNGCIYIKQSTTGLTSILLSWTNI